MIEADHYPKAFQELVTEIITLHGVEDLYEHALQYAPMWDVANGRTLCKKCHQSRNLETNPQTKLTVTQIKEIIQKVASGQKQNSVAKEYGVTPQRINQLVRNGVNP